MVGLQHDREDVNLLLDDGDYVKAAFLTHDPMLEVKKSYAEQMERQAIRDLVAEKKGILILDLDHTLFQVTMRFIDKEFPSLELWNFDSELAHSGKLQEGKTYWFNLKPNGAPFFLHLRPHLYSFLSSISRLFEIYAYTQGTSEYAKRILGGIDPKGEIFGKPYRLIAREVDPATGVPTRKNLSRVFPKEENLVLILDDRDDVWDSTASWQNLIKIVPYMYFQDAERDKLYSCSSTNDALFHPVVRALNAPPVELVDSQLVLLEKLLSDIHSEVFFSSSSPPPKNVEIDLDSDDQISDFSFAGVLIQRKRTLFSNHAFARNPRVSDNIYRLIRHCGGVVADNASSAGKKTFVNLGVSGDEPDEQLIHVWFVLVALATLSVPELALFSLQRIEEEEIKNVWGCMKNAEDGESDLEADLLDSLT